MGLSYSEKGPGRRLEALWLEQRDIVVSAGRGFPRKPCFVVIVASRSLNGVSLLRSPTVIIRLPGQQGAPLLRAASS